MTDHVRTLSPPALGETQPDFVATIETIGPEIYRYLVRLAGNRADADDLYGDTALNAFRAWDRLPADANHRAWLFRIATNAFLSRQRRRAREVALDPGREERIAAPDHDPAAAIDAAALLEEVAHQVALLPPKQRTALVLRKHHDWPYPDIAAHLRCSEDAARASVSQALRTLRASFGDRLP